MPIIRVTDIPLSLTLIVSRVELHFNRLSFSHFLLEPLKQKVLADLRSAMDSLSLASP